MRVRPSAIIEITNKCQLECLHCFTGANNCPDKRLLTIQHYDKLFDILINLGIHRVTISGGEPTLRSDYIEIVQLAHSKGIGVYLFTTGWKLKNDELSVLKKCCLNICISLDFPKTHHTELRNNGKSFQKAIDLLSTLKKSEIAVYSQTMITKKNINLLEEIIHSLEKHNINEYSLAHVSPQGHATEGPYWLFLSQHQKDILLDRVVDLRKQKKTVNTNLRSKEELMRQKYAYQLPYLHILANGTILPWFGVSHHARIVNILDTPDYYKSFEYTYNRNYLQKLFDCFSSSYSLALQYNKGRAIPIDDILFSRAHNIYR